MQPIITVDQATELEFDVTEAQLRRASGRIRAATGQTITRATSTVHLAGFGPWLLPQRPVVAVTSVAADDSARYTAGSWLLRGSTLHLCGRQWPSPTVTYTHGWAPDEIPDGLAELVCVVARRIGSIPDELQSGVQQQSAGAESMTWGMDAAIAVAGLTTGEAKALARWFPMLPRSYSMSPAPLAPTATDPRVNGPTP